MRVAVVQLNPRIGDAASNLAEIERGAKEAAEAGAQLAVFPECAVNGYMYQSLEEGLGAAEPIPGPHSRALQEIAREHKVHLVAGLLERDRGTLFNAALLASPDGSISLYRKTHTLCLGVDRFTTPGDIPYAVHELPFGRVGILICYDLRFPEASRALALAGVQIIALPTNWPVSSTTMPDVFTRSRAAENRVFVLAADRVGTERGAMFLGRSQVVAPGGQVLEEAGEESAEVLVADLELQRADRKHVILAPGEHEMDVFRDRRPELYASLSERGESVVA